MKPRRNESRGLRASLIARASYGRRDTPPVADDPHRWPECTILLEPWRAVYVEVPEVSEAIRQDAAPTRFSAPRRIVRRPRGAALRGWVVRRRHQQIGAMHELDVRHPRKHGELGVRRSLDAVAVGVAAEQSEHLHRMLGPDDARIANHDQGRRLNRPDVIGRPPPEPDDDLLGFVDQRVYVRTRRNAGVFLVERAPDPVCGFQILDRCESPGIEAVGARYRRGEQELAHRSKAICMAMMPPMLYPRMSARSIPR